MIDARAGRAQGDKRRTSQRSLGFASARRKAWQGQWDESVAGASQCLFVSPMRLPTYLKEAEKEGKEGQEELKK